VVGPKNNHTISEIDILEASQRWILHSPLLRCQHNHWQW
jgi:hypothetical protein